MSERIHKKRIIAVEINLSTKYTHHAMARIFISYKRVDKDKVFKIKDQIESALGEKCWIDLDGIESDAQFANVIIKAINDCEVFLFMYSLAHSQITDYKKDWTVRELDFAQHKEKRIVFVNLDSSPLSDWFYLLFGTMQQVDATSSQSLLRLISDLKKWLNVNNDNLSISECPQLPKKEELDSQTISGDEYDVEIGHLKFKMIKVEGGTLNVGATEEQISEADNNEYPEHPITLPTFYISQFPITQNVWEAVMGYNKAKFKKQEKAVLYRSKYNEKGHYPAETLSHDEALDFVIRLSKRTNLQFSLPSEDEWEYAARGGQKSKGYKYAGSNDINDVAWYRGNSDGCPHPVGEKQPNELGLYDMSGNVWEWTETLAHSYAAADDDISGDIFIRRGGSWWHDPTNCRVSKRYASDKNKKTSGLGLRVVIRLNN